MTRWAALSSLRWRLLAGTVVALALALLLAGLALTALFRAEIERQFDDGLRLQLDQLTALVEFDAQGQIGLDDGTLSDPRWRRPYSGLYWQVDGAQARGVLRSRSLWDATLANDPDALPDGSVHRHDVTGPQGAALRVLERAVYPAGQPQPMWRLLVAADRSASAQAVTRFGRVLAVSLGVLWCLLVAAAWAQVTVGLAPLRALQSAVLALREGRANRIAADAPTELLPLVQGFNAVLARNDEMVERARQQAGNLAHAVKTPLAVMAQAASGDVSPLGQVVREQTEATRRQVDWHLARARATAHKAFGAEQAALAPVLAGLLRVMERVFAERHLRLQTRGIDPAARCACAVQDLQDMLGNLLDNACKWARSEVVVALEAQTGAWCLVVDDDGPGVEAARRDAVLARGVRLDETVPGSGLGLHIVQELAGVYGGTLARADSPLGGLRVRLTLPVAAVN
jgi:signal transduction histidine kinase